MKDLESFNYRAKYYFSKSYQMRYIAKIYVFLN